MLLLVLLCRGSFTRPVYCNNHRICKRHHYCSVATFDLYLEKKGSSSTIFILRDERWSEDRCLCRHHDSPQHLKNDVVKKAGEVYLHLWALHANSAWMDRLRVRSEGLQERRTLERNLCWTFLPINDLPFAGKKHVKAAGLINTSASRVRTQLLLFRIIIFPHCTIYRIYWILVEWTELEQANQQDRFG